MGWDVAITLGEVLLALVALALVGFLLLTFARRRAIGHGAPLLLCASREEGATVWREGLLRLDSGRLSLYPLGGISLRARGSWSRRDLILGTACSAGDDIPDYLRFRAAVTVPFTVAGDTSMELTLSLGDYTALRSWQESGPPLGSNGFSG